MPQERGLKMKNRSIFFAGLMVIALLCTAGITTAEENATVTETTVPAMQDTPGITGPDDISAYDGPIGADSPLYGLKLALEDLDESFTTNESERVDKQMNHARVRLSEARRELAGNRTDSAQQALDQYWQKVNMTQMSLAYFGSNQTGLVHAQEMHEHHQMVLEELMLSHPNNTGLVRAYNNSLKLQEKFEEKTQVHFQKVMEKDNQTIFKAYRIEVRKENLTGEVNETATGYDKQVRNEERGKSQTTATVVPHQTNDNGQQGNGDGRQNSQDNGHGKTLPAVTDSPQDTTPSQEPSPTSQDSPGTGNGQGTGNNNRENNEHSNGKK
jgi:hypothetical protein